MIRYSITVFVVGLLISTIPFCISAHDSISQQSLHRPISNEEFDRLFPKPLVRMGDEERCEEKFNKSIAISGRCPEVPRPLSELEEVADDCANLQQFGCVTRPTEDFKHVKCTLDEEKAKDNVICPGDRVIFEKVKLNQFSALRYYLDLRADPLKTDVYFLMDATGSMGTAIETAKKRVKELLNLFKTTTDGTAYAVGYYRDESELTDGFKHVQSMTSDYGKIESALNTLEAIGGGDGDEANLVALYKVATDPKVGWRHKSRRIIVYMGDYPGHEPTCVEGVDRTITRTVVAEALQKERISILALNFRRMNDAPISYGCGIKPATKRADPGQADYLVSRTNGTIVESTDQERLVELIEHLIRNLPRKFDYNDHTCEGKVISYHSPRMPLELRVGRSMTITNTLQLQKRVCIEGGSFKCQLRYLESGADLKPTEIEVLNIEGCEDDGTIIP